MAEAVLIRSEFDPPPPGGMRRAFALAVLAHVLLILALAWGLRWKKDADTSVEAELWAAVPMQTAPVRQAPPEVVPKPRPSVPAPAPQPAPLVKSPPPVVVDSAVRDAEIALAQKKEQERIQRELKLREEAEKKAQAEKKAAEEARRKEAAAKAEAERKETEKKRLAEQKRRETEQRKEAEKKAAEDARRKEAAAKAEAERKAQADAKAAEARRKAELDRLTRLAGSSESGEAAQTSAPAGPSSGYAARVSGRVKPNITFTEKIAGNPAAEVEVRTSADGTIIASRLVKSSGVKAWDDAVLRAIEKTAKMPRDTDGRVPTPMILEFHPND